MTDKPKCVKCGTELKWGGFAHDQDTCWMCFKDIVLLCFGEVTRCRKRSYSLDDGRGCRKVWRGMVTRGDYTCYNDRK